MDVLVVADGHYYRDDAGDVYVETTYDYNFYKRYLMAFDKVYAIVRTEKVSKAPEGRKKCSGPNVEFLDLPAYTGPIEYAKNYFKLLKCAREYSKVTSCAIFRLPAATSNLMCRVFARTKKPFAVEIVVDPWENFAPGSIDSLLRPLIRYSWTKIVKDMCIRANGASYVTNKYLQEKYPCKSILGYENYFTGSYSSVELPDDSYGYPKKYTTKSVWYISHIANSYTDYGKGHIPLMRAVKIVRDKGYDIRIRFIGDGPKKDDFLKFASDLGLIEAVDFLGRLPSGAEVKKEISKSDLFVFPTKAEGLPRGLLEAMSEGLPCLSSPTCGIPEILDKRFLYEYDDYEGFAQGIINFISCVDFMEKESIRNIEVSKAFCSSKLNDKRKEFYMNLRKKAEYKNNLK